MDEISGKTKRYFEAARKIAESSNSPDYRHGAVLVKGNKIRNSAVNKNAHVSFGNRFRTRDCGHATHHAELGCILGLDRGVTTGATVYVVRIGKGGEFRMSKSCPMCHQVLAHVVVKKVVYSIDEESAGGYKL